MNDDKTYKNCIRLIITYKRKNTKKVCVFKNKLINGKKRGEKFNFFGDFSLPNDVSTANKRIFY